MLNNANANRNNQPAPGGARIRAPHSRAWVVEQPTFEQLIESTSRPQRLPIRVVVVDPFPATILGLTIALDETDDLAMAGSVLRATLLDEVLMGTTFSVLVVDPTRLGGAPLLRQLVERFEGAVVMYADLMDFDAAVLEVDAPAYVSKGEPVALLLDTIRRVAAGGRLRSQVADACWDWFVRQGKSGRSPAQERAWRRDRGLPVDEDG